MATEHEIDRLVVRLVGDQKAYQQMLKDVEKETKNTATWAEKQGERVTSAFTKALRSAQGMLSSIGSGARTAGVGSLAAGGGITAASAKGGKEFASQGDAIDKMVRESEKAAKQAGLMKERLLENTEQYKLLEKQIKLTTEQASVFKMMAERTGESIEDLTRNVEKNSAEYEKWRKEAEKFGLILTDKQQKGALELSNSWKRVKDSLKGLWVQIGAVVAPGLKSWNDLIVGLVTRATKWIQSNKAIVETISNIGDALTSIGTVLVTVGSGITMVAANLDKIVIAAGAVGGAWAAMSESVMSYGKQIMDYTGKVVQGIKDALIGGDIELAVKVLWSGVKVAWIKSMMEIDKITQENFSAIFQNLAAGEWKSALEAALIEVEILWNKMLIAVNPVFVEITNKASETWVKIVNGLDRAWVTMQNIWGELKAYVQDVADSVMAKWEGVKVFFEGLTKFVQLSFGGMFSSMLGQAVFFVTSVVDQLKTVSEFARNMASGASTAFAAPLLMALKVVGEATEKLVGSQANVTEKLMTGLGAAGAAGFDTSGIKVATDLIASAMGGAGEGIDLTGNRDLEKQRRGQRERELAERQQKRLDDQQEAARKRKFEAARREYELIIEIMEMEAKRVELEKAGQEAAAKRLASEQQALETALKQAEQARAKAEAEMASTVTLNEYADRQRRVQEEALERDKARQAFTERYDPVNRYMKQLKELNFAFKEGERDTDVYKRALRDVEKSLYDVETASMSAMNAAKYGSQEWVNLLESGQKGIEGERIRREGMAEAAKRQEAMDKDVAQREEQRKIEEMYAPNPEAAPGPSGNAQESLGKVIGETVARGLNEYFVRIAEASESVADKLPTFESLGLGAP